MLQRTLTEVRTARGLSMGEAAQITGVHKSVISKIEAGAMPNHRTVLRLEQGFNLKPGTLKFTKARKAA